MKKEKLMIRTLQRDENPPYELLFLADPSHDYIADYLRRGSCFVAEIRGTVVGVYVLLETRPATVELMNIAVEEAIQGKGYGKKLLLDAIEKAKSTGAKSIEVGTGNSSLSQLGLYQLCGFRLSSIERDYFVYRYDDKIVENGIQCRDMVRLTMEL